MIAVLGGSDLRDCWRNLLWTRFTLLLGRLIELDLWGRVLLFLGFSLADLLCLNQLSTSAVAKKHLATERLPIHAGQVNSTNDFTQTHTRS